MTDDTAGLPGINGAPGTDTAKPARVRSPKQQALDAVWEALIDVCGIERPPAGKVFPKQLKSRIGKARTEIVGDSEPPTAEEVVMRAAEYRSRFPGLDLTLEALAKHWPSLRPAPTLDAADPVINCLIDVFNVERPGPEGEWPRSLAQRLTTAAREISVASGPPAPGEILRRAGEYRRRFRNADFSLEAFAKHWPTLRTTAPFDPDEPVVARLIEVFGFERPAEGGEWPTETAGRLSHAAQEISAANGAPDGAEIAKRVSEYRHRWPERDFTLEALVRHWAELAHAAPRSVADRTVSDYEGWSPAYPGPHEDPFGPVLPAAVAPSRNVGFDRGAHHRATVMAERREVAVRLFEKSRPAWAEHATPLSLAKADPPYDPRLLRSLRPWVANPTPYLVLYGPPGTGKSWIAAAIAHRFAHNSTTTYFVRYSELITRIRSEWRTDSDEISILELASDVGLLVLDDLGAIGDIRDWQLAYFDTLLNRRLDNGKPTILTTNLRSENDPDDAPRLLNPTLGDLEAHIGRRFASRFALGLVLGVGGPDRRQQPARMDQTRETSNAIRHGGDR